jgi:hypothetical protein
VKDVEGKKDVEGIWCWLREEKADDVTSLIIYK